MSAFYEREARRLIRDVKNKQAKPGKPFAYEDLADLLRRQGMKISRQSLTNKITRGTFSLAFAMEVLALLGENRIDIPPLPAAEKAKIPRR
ncbi:hypothetical protein FN976_06410 [Caenimonas sedimenti]|uniref:DUF6471 domain-containing protein n=1 Tax=Caenimonas sedimenti TaxID=2596921 RepID=A0A562ZUQ8_9BURK|nr:DUF6471 domain-containing protein [Caenimonas sedimenti]TWO72329.1 hypothetical protein FN976_06410 [Caenimonas sedimenti]